MSYDLNLRLPVIPGKQHTLNSLVALVARVAKDRNLTPYKIAQQGRLTLTAVKHFFYGYQGQPAMQSTVRDPDSVGRCRLDTLLAILAVIGVDIEVVARKKPGRDD